MSVKLGFIGAGNINRNHVKNSAEAGWDVAYIADTNEAAANTLAAPHKAKVLSDWHDLLKTDIDGIVIGTPNSLHKEMAIACLNAGKHVFLEKPMAMNVAECDEIIAARDRAGKQVQMGMVQRFNGSVGVLKKFIADGHVGNIYSAQTYWYRRRGIPGFGGWFTTKKLSGGGGLIDIGVHMLDLALYLMDFPKPVSVSGKTWNVWKDLDTYTYTSMWGSPVGKTKDVDDYALANIRFEDGSVLQLNVSWALNIGGLPSDMGVRLFGDKGGVALNGFKEPVLYGEQAGHLVDTKPQYKETNAGFDEIVEFGKVIQGEMQPTCSAEQGRIVQSVLDAIYESSEKNNEVPCK